MITVKLDDGGKVVGIATNEEFNTPAMWRSGLLQNRSDWASFERAEEVAAQLTEVTGVVYYATDAGQGVYPRFDVQRAPQVGDEVSEGFNGDCHPCGTIAKITPTGIIVTSEGRRFRRKGKSGCYKNNGWSLVHGHHTERNPHF